MKKVQCCSGLVLLLLFRKKCKRLLREHSFGEIQKDPNCCSVANKFEKNTVKHNKCWSGHADTQQGSLCRPSVRGAWAWKARHGRGRRLVRGAWAWKAVHGISSGSRSNINNNTTTTHKKWRSNINFNSIMLHSIGTHSNWCHTV